MKKLIFLSIILLTFNFGLTEKLQAQTASVTVNYPGFLACGGCVVCGGDYYCFNTLSSYCGNTAACITKTFTNPVPAGNIVTGVNISYFSAGCAGGSLSANINGQSVPTVNEGSSGCLCSNAPCVQSASSSSVFPCGLPGYNNGAGASNSIQLCTGADVCINRLVITLTYAPANQASPATQPTSVLGQTSICPSATETYSCPVVSNASSYDWTLPPGWTLNSGAGTNVITATPGSAGNVCVRGQNLCGNSAYTCISVGLLTASTPPSSANASPNPVCAGASGTTLSLSGGSLGTAANWNWYSGACNAGTFVGSGSSIAVSPASTTTYYVSAAGTCNTTACASVVLTVNPAPTANAGSPQVLNCTTTNTVLSGSGGGTYSWSGPGIVSGSTSPNPTVNLPGTYSLIVTNAGCPSAVSTVLVTQDITPPNPTASASNNIDCFTPNATLTGTGGGTYSWSGTGIISGGNTANPVVNSTGPYVVTVTAANGCTASASTSLTQDITPPNPTAASSSSLDCVSTTAVLNSTGGGSYSWSGAGIVSGGNTANPVVNGTGPYIVTVTAANGCTASASTNVTQDVTPPSPTATNNTTLTCVTTSAILNATGGVSYSWSGTGIISGGNTANPTVNGTGPYVVTVTAANGCTATASTSVPQDNTPPSPSASSSGALTCTNTAVTLTGFGGGTYLWTGPGIVSGGSTATPLVNLTGTYDVTVTAANGCTATANTIVTQNTVSPTVTMPGTQTITCSAPSVTLVASANPATSTPVWTGGVTAGANSFTATASSAGDYTLTITDPSNGCTAFGITQVVPSAGFPSVTATASNSITCVTATAQVVATTSTTPVSYSWSGPGITSGATTATASVNTSGQYTVVVQNTTSLCSSTITVDVALNNTIPSVSLTTSATNGGTITCTNTLVTINSSVSPIGSPYTYTWSASSGTITNQANATFTGAGVYTLEVTNTLTGCVATTTNSANNTFTVYADQLYPTPTLTATSSNSIIGCLANNAVVTLSCAVTNTNTSIVWLPNAISSSSLNATTAGVYTVVVTDTINGCSISPQYTVNGGTTPPQNISAGTSANIACGDTTTVLTGTTTTSNTSYSWAGPSSTSVISGGNTLSPTVGSVGDYTLTVTNNSTGCSDSAVVNVVQASASASITANPTTGISPLLVDFTGAGSGTPAFNWNFGDGNTSNTQNPSNIFVTGSYTVTLTTTSGSCTATSTIVIVVEDGFNIEIPNVFTPNGDGSNDLFTIKSTGVKEISLQIFNRWGEKLYELSGAKASWDGHTSSGAEVSEGTYFFFVKATGFDGAEFEKQGTVNLFR